MENGDKIVRMSANVHLKLQICVIHGRGLAIVLLVGAVPLVTDSVRY